MISLVVPLYNKERSIGRTISSVLTQTFKNFEIIVVNDGSTDNSFEAVKQIGDSRIRIFSQSNSGVSKARNVGVNLAKYKYIALLDADDLWEPTFLEEMVSLVNDFPEASLFGCSWAYISSDGQKTISNYGIKKNFRGYVSNYFEIGLENTLFNTSSVVFDRNAFFEIGMFDESLKIGEDLDLWFRFALKKKIAYINKPLSFYLIGAENRASLREKSKKECLVWNLDKYKEHEKTNHDFKKFMDSWRFHHIIDFFEGRRDEINEAKTLLKEINLNNYAFFWKLMRYSPIIIHVLLYRLRIRYIDFKQSIKLYMSSILK